MMFNKGHKIKTLLIITEDGREIDVRLQSGLISYYEDVADSSFHWEIDLADADGRLEIIRSGNKVILRIEHPSGEDIIFLGQASISIKNDLQK